ncbi:hypothetical protein D5S17_24055 [Pseudonocardiaceae bacterium YIM PH 21723]|nr:hypothetical protein D5S17_24055 [Pseudonocardiaceae bacterium YIM PH 21723]
MIALTVALVLLLCWIGLIWFAVWRHAFWCRTTTRIHRHLSRPAIVVLAIALIALPLGSAGLAWSRVACFGGGFDTAIRSEQGECVGVTGSGRHFSGELGESSGDRARQRMDAVQDAITGENAKLADDAPYLTVAVLVPIDSALFGARLIHSLEGYAAAQRHINAQPVTPIRLVLGNIGALEQQWRTAVDQVVELSADPVHPLVAVVGLGLSRPEMAPMARVLSDHQIPMVADIATGDDITGPEPTPGFYRVAYANSLQVNALMKALPAIGASFENVVVLRSGNRDDGYSRGAATLMAELLNNDFKDQLPRRQEPRDFGPYDDNYRPANDPSFESLALTLCGASGGSGTVFYSGRSLYLSILLQQLQTSNKCSKVTVISISDAAVLSISDREAAEQPRWRVLEGKKALADGRVSLYYVPLASPITSKAEPAYELLHRQFQELGYPDSDLDTGYAINAWDALTVVSKWITFTTERKRPLTAREVFTATRDILRGAGALPVWSGAGGGFCFDNRGDRQVAPGYCQGQSKLLPPVFQMRAEGPVPVPVG